MTQEEKETLEATLKETRRGIKHGDLTDVWDIFNIFDNVLETMIYKK